MEFIKYLRRSARNDDKKSFNLWAMGQISTDQCINEFKKHNKMEDIHIDSFQFQMWLRSLGYIRRWPLNEIKQ